MTLLSNFYRADADYGTRLAQALNVDPAQVRSRIQASTAKPATAPKTAAR